MPVRDGALLGAGADPTVFYIAVMGFSGLPMWSLVIISNYFTLVNMCVGCTVLTFSECVTADIFSSWYLSHCAGLC
jgi:hypothetical protein